ncbi:MAG: PTS sugar transporter subunit IIC [Syntrophales bacterium]|nr:PTS sugar transporter subunit IIC [Syntrophales bacterium]
MIMNVLIVSIAGGLLCLDRVFIQTLISRPIVAAPVTGAILGDPYTGLIAGAFIELLWIDRLPIGAYVPPNDTAAAIVIAACAIESGRILGHLPQGLIALAVLIFVPFAYLAQQMDRWIIRGNEKPANEALKNAISGAPPAIARKHLFAALKTWLLSAGLILIAIPIGVGVMTWSYPCLAPRIIRGLDLVYGLLPLIGTAVALNTLHLRGALPIFCAVFLSATVILHYIRSF